MPSEIFARVDLQEEHYRTLVLTSPGKIKVWRFPGNLRPVLKDGEVKTCACIGLFKAPPPPPG